MSAWLAAEPNPLPPDRDSTTISWKTGDGSWGDVYLAVDAATEVMFAGGPEGTQQSPTMLPDHTYIFRLYTVAEPRTLLAEARVSRETTAPSLTADPPALPATPGADSTTIAWNTGDGRWGDVFVAIDDEPEVLCAGGASGSQVLGGIAPGRRYSVRLYAAGSSRHRLCETTVTRAGSPPILVASLNPVPDSWTEPISVQWSTGDSQTGQVFLAIDDGEAFPIGVGTDSIVSGLTIDRHSFYTFRLYRGLQRERELASLVVTRGDERREALIDLAILAALAVPVVTLVGALALVAQGMRRLLVVGGRFLGGRH